MSYIAYQEHTISILDIPTYFTAFLNTQEILPANHLEAKMAWKYLTKYLQIPNI
jgi:hypothetical protein